MFLMPNRGVLGVAGNPARWDENYMHVSTAYDAETNTVTGGWAIGILFSVADTPVTGKMYWEFQKGAGNWTGIYPGLVDEAHRSNAASSTAGTELWRNGIGWVTSGRFTVDGSNVFSRPYYDGITATNLMFAFDADTNELWVGQDGAWQSKTPNVHTGYTDYAPTGAAYPACVLYQVGTAVKLGGTASALAHAIPTGFTALDGST